MPERKYISHSAEYCTGMHTNQKIKDGMVGYVGRRADTVKHYKKSEKKWKKYLKALKKQTKMLYIIAKKSGSRHEIDKIGSKCSKKSMHNSTSSSSDELYSDSSLAINII